jgi:transposase
VFGDDRILPDLQRKKALCILIYALGKGSFSFLGKLLDCSKMTVMRWVKTEANSIPEPIIDDSIVDVEFDEMWYFLKKKIKNSGSSEQFAVYQGELWDGLQATVIVKRSKNSSKNLNI